MDNKATNDAGDYFSEDEIKKATYTLAADLADPVKSAIISADPVKPEVVEVEAPIKTIKVSKGWGLPPATIEDTRRLMPAFVEARIARQEKIHPLVIVNKQGDSDKVEELPGAVLRRDGKFYLVRVGEAGSKRAAWYRLIGEEKKNG
jgi:hypothetical protein